VLISWNTTRECNLRCQHCYRDAGPRERDELTTAEGFDLLEEMARAGFQLVVLSGGEPMLRADIYDLVRQAARVGMRPVLGSNGMLISRDVARRLKDAGAARVGISLDSANPEFHNQLRLHPQAWQLAVAGMEACREAGLPFQVHTTVTESNRDQVLSVTDFAAKIGAAGHHVFFLVPAGRGVDLEADSLKAAEYERLLGDLLKKQRVLPIEIKPTCAPQFMRIAKQMGVATRFGKGCLAGTSYCVVLPNGAVHPCPYLPLKVGNVRETPFSQIWARSPIFERLRHDPLLGKCGGCEYQEICGGCRARAYYYSDGDYMAEEPWCLWQPKKARAA